jgi:hypothetical protein
MHAINLKLIQKDLTFGHSSENTYLIMIIDAANLYEVLAVLSEEINLNEGRGDDVDYDEGFMDHIATVLHEILGDYRLQYDDKDADFGLHVHRWETKSKMYFSQGRCASQTEVVVCKHNAYQSAVRKRLNLLPALTEVFLSSALQSSVGFEQDSTV